MKLSRYARNLDRAIGGVWHDFEAQEEVPAPVDGHFCIRIAAWDNPKHRDAQARLHMERARELKDATIEAASAIWRDIGNRAMAEAIVVGWANADNEDGTPLDYSADAAYRVLCDKDLYAIRQFVVERALVDATYRRIAEEAAAKN